MTTIKKEESKNEKKPEFRERVLKGVKAAIITISQGFLFGLGSMAANRLLTSKLIDHQTSVENDDKNVLDFDRKASNA